MSSETGPPPFVGGDVPGSRRGEAEPEPDGRRSAPRNGSPPAGNGSSGAGSPSAGWSGTTPSGTTPSGATPSGEPVVDLRVPRPLPDDELSGGTAPLFRTRRAMVSQPADPWSPVDPWDPLDEPPGEWPGAWIEERPAATSAHEPSAQDPPAQEPSSRDPSGRDPSRTGEPNPVAPPVEAIPDGDAPGPRNGEGPGLFSPTDQPAAPAVGHPPAPVPSEDQPELLPATQMLTGSLTRRLLGMVAPAALALVVAFALAVGLSIRAGSLEDRAAELSDAAATSQQAELAVERLWAGVTGLVAGGVGQQVVTAAEVQGLVGEVRALSSDGADASAAGARTAFAAAVDSLLRESDGDPLALGNELDALSGSHHTAAEATDAEARAASAEAHDQRGAAGRTRLAAAVVLALGVVLAGVALLLARRRIFDRLDLPVARLRDAVRRVKEGEPDVRSRAGGLPEVASLGAELDEVVLGLGARIDALARRAEWGEQSRMIFEALELADDEDALFDVVARALGVIEPTRPVELLMAERGPSRMAVVASNPNVEPPADPQDTDGVCVALRRGQVSVFESSSSLNSCPMLRHRSAGPISGACVPVSVAAKPVGVLHMTGPEHHPPDEHTVERLVSLASQIGNRLGALRTLETSRHEASTDGLTGLPNRRSLETDVADLLDREIPFVMVLADLDKFKRLNDTFGHEVGDRALQLFAGVLRDNVRGNDVVARLGGEEFVLVYPNMSVEISIEAINRLRAALARTVGSSPLPSFTCSFGVTHSSFGTDGDSILRIADAGLLRAKELGGDQAVFADGELAAEVFAAGAGRDRPGRATDDDRR